MFQLLYPLYIVFAFGLILVIVKYALSRRELKRQKDTKIDLTDERKSWMPFRNRTIEYGITICITFVSFFGSYVLQKYKSLITEKRQGVDICFSAQNEVSYFDAFLKSYGMDTSDNFDRMLGIDTSILRSFVKDYSNGYKPFYILDHLPQDQIENYLKPIPFSTMSWLESNEKSALKNTFNERIPSKYRIRTLYAAYQFDSLRQYMLCSEQQYLQNQILPDSFASRLRAINISNGNLIDMLNPTFHSKIHFRFPNY